MKKLFISQPMREKSDEEILKERELCIITAKKVLNVNEIEVLETFFNDFTEDAKPLQYLARSLDMLAKADIAFFAKGWEEARGCKIEHECAIKYDIPTVDYRKIPQELTIFELTNCFYTASVYSMKYVVIGVKIPNCPKPEIIIIAKENFDTKLNYYKNAYNEDLTLKTCDDIKIIGFSYGNNFKDLEDNIIKQ